jgi:hypothetical protein
METLHTQILNEARDEVARECDHHVDGKCESWSQLMETMIMEGSEMDIELYSEKAALLAMEKQAEFFRWASIHKWRHDDPFMDGGYWYKNSGVYRGKRFTELELFEIWKGQKA